MATDKKPRMKLITPEFRGSYVHIVKPKAFEEGDDPEYSMVVVLPKDAVTTKKFIAQLRAAINEACMEKLGKVMPDAQLKHFPIKDGDADEDEYFHGNWTIRIKSNFKPGAIDKAGNKLFSEDDLYSGAWYVASCDVWAWSNPKFGKGVSVNLNNVLKVRDDEKFGGGAAAEEDFKHLIDGGAGDAGGEEGDLGI